MVKGVHNFPKGISPKVNLIAQLDFELTYYNAAVQYISHYTTMAPVIKYFDIIFRTNTVSIITIIIIIIIVTPLRIFRTILLKVEV